MKFIFQFSRWALIIFAVGFIFYNSYSIIIILKAGHVPIGLFSFGASIVYYFMLTLSLVLQPEFISLEKKIHKFHYWNTNILLLIGMIVSYWTYYISLQEEDEFMISLFILFLGILFTIVLSGMILAFKIEVETEV